MKISTDLWFDVARAKAESVVQDPEDRKLLAPETYDLIHAIDYPHMGASGIFGDYVEVEAFQQLGDRFLLACELIKTMESNSLEMPDSPDPAPAAPSEEDALDKLEAMIEGQMVCNMGEGEPCLRCDLHELVQRARIEKEDLRSQLARKNEGIKKALAYLPEYLRHLRAKNNPKALSLTNDLEDIRAAARTQDAGREP